MSHTLLSAALVSDVSPASPASPASSSLPLVVEVATESGPMRVVASVTHSQARRVLDYAKRLDGSAERRPKVSPRERQVLDGFSRGLAYKEIAAELDISIETVRTYVRSLYRKLGAHSVTEAIERARDVGLL